MKLIAVSVGRRKEVPYMGKTAATGIFKQPLNGRVMLRTLNLDGDEQVDLRGHGGIYKAVCVYTVENYEFWKQTLGRTNFRVPQFGENFTVDGMLENQIHIGDIFRVGGALVEVTQPRVPCYRLGIKMEDVTFPGRFLKSCRVGFYLRVLTEGEVGAGDMIELVKTDPEEMSVRKVCHLYYFDRENVEDCERAVRIKALSPGWREGFEDRLASAGIPVQREAGPKDEKCCPPEEEAALT